MEENTSRARVLSPGLAIGNAFIVDEPEPAVVEQRRINVEAELQKFGAQVDHIAGELSGLFRQISKEIDVRDAQIIQAQQMILSDEGFKKKVIGLISAEFVSAETAVERVMHEFARRMEASADEYMQERASDFIDLVRYFKRRSIEKFGIPEMPVGRETILIAGELLPSIVLACKRSGAAGVLAESGAPTSHAAILARSFGIPVLVSSSPMAEKISNGDKIILDAYESIAILHPEPLTLGRYQKQPRYDPPSTTGHKQRPNLPAATGDGTNIVLGVNIGRFSELRLFSPDQIDEIGLFRTELLFMFDQENFPTYEQQARWYDEIVQHMNGKPVTFRALDVGGDKFLPYFSMGTQSNPYLGLRAHRVFRYHPEILETQLRAIMRAARSGPVRILYPMINNLEEIDYLNAILSRIEKADAKIEVGIMVETPASVLMIEPLLEQVDFVSIGTNDLVQYTLTVDRNNENVMSYYQPLHPVILRMIDKVVTAAGRCGKPVSLCGEIASDPRWTPLLLGLGIRSLSMAPLMLPPVKARILSLQMQQCRRLAEKALRANYVEEVNRLLDDFFLDASQVQANCIFH